MADTAENGPLSSEAGIFIPSASMSIAIKMQAGIIDISGAVKDSRRRDVYPLPSRLHGV
jgi:hypothetical protein